MEPKVSLFLHLSLSWARSFQSPPFRLFFFKSRSSIIYRSASFLQVSPPEFCMHFFFPHIVPHFPPISQSLLGLPWWEAHYAVFSTLRTFWRLGPNILLSTLIWNTLSLCSSPDLRDQISHVCKTTSKLILPCILIFVCLDRKREGKRFWNKWLQAFLHFHLLLTFRRRNYFFLILIHLYIKCE